MYKQILGTSVFERGQTHIDKNSGERRFARAIIIIGLLIWSTILPFASAAERARPAVHANASAPPTVTLSPASINYAAQAVGTSGTSAVLTQLTTDAPLSISSVTLTGDFVLYNYCGSNVTTGSCFIFATFKPTATGMRTGVLTVTYGAGATQTVALSGLGVPAGSGATTTSLGVTGSTGNYTLTGTVLGTSSSGSPTGSISFVDTANNNLVLGKIPVGASNVGLSLTNNSSGESSLSSPQTIVSADFNGDGKADIAVLVCNAAYCSPNAGSGVFIELSDGTGSIISALEVPSAPFGNDLVAGDFNGDGKTDLAIIGSGPSGTGVTVLLGKGDGTFTQQSVSVPSANYLYAASGDFNKDGKDDLVLVAQNGTFPNYAYTATIILGQANGTFVNGPVITTAGASAVTAADFNRDGIADFAVIANFAGPASVQAFLGKGDGTFQAPVATNAGTALSSPSGNRFFAHGDFNGDGKTDLVIEGPVSNGTVSTTDGFLVLTGKGDGSFTVGSPIAITPSPSVRGGGGGSTSGSIVVTDFNGDGKDDVVVLNDDVVQVLLSNGDGTFTLLSSLDSGAMTDPNFLALTVGDFNADGLPDIFQSNSDGNVVNTDQAQRTETAIATLANVAIPGTGTHNIQAVYEGDAKFGTSTSTVAALTATPIATTLALTSSASSSTAGAQLALTAQLSPYSDLSLTTTGESITFLRGGASIGTGTLSSGIATLNINSLPVGTDSVTANYPGDSNFSSAAAPAVPIVVSAAVPAVTLSHASLTFASQATGSASAAQSVTITNSGQAALAITSITSSGDFAQTNTCGASVAAGGSCAISVTFNPTATGDRPGTISIADNATGAPQTVALDGTGSGVSLSTTSTALTIASVGGSATANVHFSSAGGFSGTLNLSCSVSYQGTGTPSDAPTCSLNPAQSQVSSGTPATATLTVNTTAASAKTGMDLKWLGGTEVALGALLLFGFKPRRNWSRLGMLAVLALVVTSAIAGCGSKSTTVTAPTNPGTTTGSYKVTVTATNGTMTSSISVPLSVQ
jgi:hypothetical protein